MILVNDLFCGERVRRRVLVRDDFAVGQLELRERLEGFLDRAPGLRDAACEIDADLHAVFDGREGNEAVELDPLQIHVLKDERMRLTA